MADKPIGQLNVFPAGAEIGSANTLFPVQYSNAAYQLNGQRFVNALAQLLDGHGGITAINYTPPIAPSLRGVMEITLADESNILVDVQHGRGIVSVSGPATVELEDTYTINYNDGTSSTFKVRNGQKGDTGEPWYLHIRYASRNPQTDSDLSSIPDAWIGIYSGQSSVAPSHYSDYAPWYQIKGSKGDQGEEGAGIQSISLYSGNHAPGTLDTYRITFTNGTSSTFQVYNGSDGEGSPGSQTPLMNGTAEAGSASAYSREDHVHPTDTTRQELLTFDNAPAESSSNPVRSGGVFSALSGKADKVSNATSGNIAALDLDGNIADSGRTLSDFATAANGTAAYKATYANTAAIASKTLKNIYAGTDDMEAGITALTTGTIYLVYE